MNTDDRPLNSGPMEGKNIDKVLPHICDVCGKSRCSPKHNGAKCAKIRQQRGFSNANNESGRTKWINW